MSQSDREMRFVQVFQEHYHQLFAYVHTLVRNSADAEDVVQQTSLILWKKFDEYQPESNFFAWACVAARFEAMKFLRRDRRYRAHFSEAFQLKLAETMAGIRPEVVTARYSIARLRPKIAREPARADIAVFRRFEERGCDRSGDRTYHAQHL